MPSSITYTVLPSPIGPLTLVASASGLRECRFPLTKAAPISEDGVENPDHPILARAATELAAYFAGTRTTFTISLDLHGTAFQLAVWTLLQDIPYGTTTTYGALAQQLGDLKKTRAVGMANGRNPVGIIVPCHRVIGADGALTGFGGGLEAKTYLLQREQQQGPRVALSTQGSLF